MQIGLRTLITDNCTRTEQAEANAWAGGYSNLAATLANLAAYMNISPHPGDPFRSDHTVFMDPSTLHHGFGLTRWVIGWIGFWVGEGKT